MSIAVSAQCAAAALMYCKVDIVGHPGPNVLTLRRVSLSMLLEVSCYWGLHAIVSMRYRSVVETATCTVPSVVDLWTSNPY